MTLLENVPLAQYTTLGVGGPARWLAQARTDSEIVEALGFARAHSVPYFILGGGSNLLVSDEGFPGVVIRIANTDLSAVAVRDSGDLLVKADAGVEWDAVVHAAVQQNAAGIECLAGIPGSVGGTPVQNVGAYGQEVATTITEVHAIDIEAERPIRFSPSECGFAYRHSIFNTTHRSRYAITRVAYKLKLNQPPHLEYRDVKQYFAEHATTQPTLAETAAAVRTIRARKGMLLSPADPDSRSAGSFFKNPIVPAANIQRIATSLGVASDEIPHWSAGEGSAKLSAAWLIERAGFHKGFRMGNAGISSKHTLALVNLGGATASEIVALRDAVVNEVEARFAIRLEQEPVLLGFPHPSH